MMRAAVIAAVGLIILSGCAVPDPEPAPDLAPEFLAIICPANEADLAFNAVWEGESSTLEQIVFAATTARDADAQAAASLDGLADRWPAEYGTDLAIVKRMYLAKVEDYTPIVEATSLDGFSELTFRNPTAGNEAYVRVSQKIGATGC